MPIRDVDFASLGVQDALDLAILMEEEAEERYLELEQQMELHRSSDAARFFHNMAHNEKKHATELEIRRLELFGSAPRHIHRSMLFDVEAPEYDQARAFITTREALHVALRSELKAQAFFDAALPLIRDPHVTSLFTLLRDEEAEHVHNVRSALAALPPEDGVPPEAFTDDPIAL